MTLATAVQEKNSKSATALKHKAVSLENLALLLLSPYNTVMAIRPTCDMCKQELTAFGGLLFSPPKKNIVKKFHLCVTCYKAVVRSFAKK